MKQNTTDTKRLIEQAIRLLPQDNTLSEARFHLKAALGHVEHVEQKRLRREMVQKQNEMEARFKQMGQTQNGAVDLRENLKIIDELIAAEQKKLEELAAKKASRQQRPDDQDESDLING